MSSALFWQAINIVLGLMIAFTCGCRVNVSNKSVYRRVRWSYALLGTAAIVHIFAPTVGQSPGWLVIIFEFAVLCVLFAGSHRWKHGAPDDVVSGVVPLKEVARNGRRRAATWLRRLAGKVS